MPEPTNRNGNGDYDPEDWDDDDEEEEEEVRERATLEEWHEGMIGTCSVCRRTATVEESYRRPDGTCGCPRDGGNFLFYEDDQGRTDVEPIDLTREWRPGATGRCNYCGLTARVSDDVKRDDGTAACEMCGLGTFEFIYGLPYSPYHAPRPRNDYPHEVEGMTLLLRRQVSPEMLVAILSAFRDGAGSDDILNDAALRNQFQSDGFTRYTIKNVQDAENTRRWSVGEPMLYSEDERERLSAFILLRVPMTGRMKIVFAGLRGQVERWVTSDTFNALTSGDKALLYDGHYKAISRDSLDLPRYKVARDFYPNMNALLGRGVIRAWSMTGEEVTVPTPIEPTVESSETEPPSETDADTDTSTAE